MKRNKHLILIFTVAFMMFTSVWAGTFAATTPDPEQTDTNTDGNYTVMDLENGSEGGTENDTNDNESTRASSENYTFAAPQATLSGKDVTLTWSKPVVREDAPEGTPAVPDNVAYEPEVAEAPAGVSLNFNTENLESTTTLSVTGTYKFQVKATFEVGEDVITVTSIPSGEIEFTAANTPADVTGASAASLYKKVAVTWNENTDDPFTTGYIIKRYYTEGDKNSDSPEFTRDTNNTDVKNYLNISNGKITWTNKNKIEKGHTYWYAIYAYYDESGEYDEGSSVLSANPYIVKGQGQFVERMIITGTFKQTKTLKSHDKYHKKKTFKKGYPMKACGFASGEYLFEDGGNIYWVNRTRIKKPKAIYSTSVSYDKIAEDFVNDKRIGSSTGYLIWVSFYTQHVYVFTGKTGNWKLQQHWECSTGKASTPSPMPINGLKALNKFRPKKRHAIKWWNGYSGQNALHGKKKSWKMGKPKSHGCIRNYDWGAKYIYQHCKKGTRVYCW